MRRLFVIGILLIALVATMPVVSAQLMHLTYDANGNLVTGDGRFRVYDEFNNLVQVFNGSDSSGELLEAYRFHPSEEKSAVKYVYEGGVLKESKYYHGDGFVTIINASGTFHELYVYQDGVLVAQKTSRGTQFIHSDPLGSSTLVTNSLGDVVENTTFTPFGEIWTGGNSTRYDYEDKEYSSAVGAYDFNFRQYCSEIGIFCKPDTVIPDLFDPQMLNRYSFERNNPYRYNDPDGHVLAETIFVLGTILLTGVIYGTLYTEFAVMKQQTFGTYELYQESKAQGITIKDLMTNKEVNRALSEEANRRLFAAATSAFTAGTISGELDAIGDVLGVPGFGEAVTTYFGLDTSQPKTSRVDLSKVTVKGQSGLSMTLTERVKNTQTINNDDGFVKIRDGVYRKITTERTPDGKTKTTTRIVYN